MEGQQFIEVRRVLSNKLTKENESIELETIDVSLIKTFRAWHKGAKDSAISGDMTILILKPDEKPIRDFKALSEDDVQGLLPNDKIKYAKEKDLYEKELLESKRTHSMIIQDNYSEFADRLSAKVTVKRVNEIT